ncbi:ATP synthase F0F1 subunit epsilon [Roseovarius atlanticus]|uniref:ATP synthase epsilon chain n=1 Tax=Roseovarius atlanticus TaxID=1641875 RepID=A0A0T5NWA1_9RHOB|nr:F0F1 ATP synthase subunit epsilon [Roseovarius atlanticus]KRS13030.1 ATP synthase F0F1 subunit epsilon [Roseovarius atlanticus]
MADTVQFDLVSPERLLASVEATEVQIPGTDGDMTAMADHTPLITTLRPGVVRVSGPEGDKEYVVTGGFAEINADSISVLAERALSREDMTQDEFQKMVDEATDRLAKAQETFVNEPGPVDDAAKLLADMVAMGDQIGLSTPSKVPAP